MIILQSNGVVQLRWRIFTTGDKPMQDYQVATTERLDIAYLEWNRQGARTAILLHS